jgi:hypothetical protein
VQTNRSHPSERAAKLEKPHGRPDVVLTTDESCLAKFTVIGRAGLLS